DFYNQSIRISTDNGNTFKDVFTPPQNDILTGMDFSDDIHGVLIASFRAGNPWYYTEDGGKTWNATDVNMESWSVYAQKGTSNFFAAPEGWSNGPLSTTTNFYRSTDFGKTWKTTFSFPVRMTGAVSGVGNILYTQTQYPPGPSSGLYRSVDSGSSWTWIGGPNQFNDTYFTVLPGSCNRTIIFAGGKDNKLYKAIDTINGGISSAATSSISFAVPQPTAAIKIFDTTGVEIAATFPQSSPLIGLIPDQITYSISYDSKTIDVLGAKNIIPPNGWSVGSVNMKADKLEVTLLDTAGLPLTKQQSFGRVIFIGLNDPSAPAALVELEKIVVSNDCRTINAFTDIETRLLRRIIIATNGVAALKGNNIPLTVVPNPASTALSISYEPMKTHSSVVSISDSKGDIIVKKTIPIEQSGTYTMDLTSIASGRYILLIEAGSTTAIANLTVQK
ncbi:MAG TPA: T9SS type A sorting domain-containing protein, partial [Candidatus Kapabacteria bacterium]|nr:T9SS type A sorting domain-containing protein [Candidatus Kapabacteria bacterium]